MKARANIPTRVLPPKQHTGEQVPLPPKQQQPARASATPTLPLPPKQQQSREQVPSPPQPQPHHRPLNQPPQQPWPMQSMPPQPMPPPQPTQPMQPMPMQPMQPVQPHQPPQPMHQSHQPASTSATPNRLPGPPVFTGAFLPVCGVEALIVVVRPWILTDIHEANLYVIAFQYRFQRAIILMAQNEIGVPTYYGPATIVQTIAALPFEIIPWQRIPYLIPKPKPWMLPIPPEPAPTDSTSRGTRSSLDMDDDDDLSKTRIYDPAVRERFARTTKR
jgi:hypothetical protein